MDAATLARAMGCSQTKADQHVADMNTAMIQAECTTTNRAAMWCAQIGHESLGLVYFEELASGAAYEGRTDLGNTRTGDGVRFKGRGPLQVTGRQHYGDLGAWCKQRGLVDRADYFVLNPAAVATSRWGFLAAAWYWTVERPHLNGYADAGDILSASRDVNGWVKVPNGYEDRVTRWDRCRGLGAALLPTSTGTAEEDDMNDEDRRMLREIYNQVAQGTGTADPKTWGWQGWDGGTGEKLTLIDYLRRANVEMRQLRNAVAKLTK